jgi:hypothetical protein
MRHAPASPPKLLAALEAKAKGQGSAKAAGKR